MTAAFDVAHSSKSRVPWSL